MMKTQDSFLVCLWVLLLSGFTQADNPFLPPSPYPSVGFRQTTIPINFERKGLSSINGITELPIDLWYPSSADTSIPGTRVTPASIKLFAGFDLPIDQAFGPSIDEVYSFVPIADDGDLPVVVFSHGTASVTFQNVYLYYTLAQQGFVVVVIDHLGDSSLDGVRFFGQFRDTPVDAAFNRIGDVWNVLDTVESKFPPGAVDVNQAAVVGHSAGALTTLLVGVLGDPRVKALVPLAPLFTVGLDTLEIPTFVMSASLDLVVPAAFNIELVRDALNTRVDPPTTLLVDFEGAAHNSFTDLCFLQSILEDAGLANVLPVVGFQVDRACKDPEIVDFVSVNDITALYTTAFLKVELGLDDSRDTYASLLTRDYAAENNFALSLEDTVLGSPAPSAETDSPTKMPTARPTPSPTPRPTAAPSLRPTSPPTLTPPPTASPSPTGIFFIDGRLCVGAIGLVLCLP